jgi:hypothetical protein
LDRGQKFVGAAVEANVKNPVGRPAHVPSEATRRQVEMCAAFGNTEEQIAQILDISPPTLRLHYRSELEIGHVNANNKVAMNLFRQAMKDDPKCVPAAIFWLRTRAGWSEYANGLGGDRLKPLGKKEAARIAAEAPPEDSGWSDLLH